MKKETKPGRRNFFKIAALGGLGASIMSPMMVKSTIAKTLIGEEDKTKTNVEDALQHPRNETLCLESIRVRLFR